nr:putative reverse transcriptase domain-containing protein [Tanacetum cinerariifolium]
MLIWKDSSYFDTPSKDVEDGTHNENDDKDKSEDDNSPKEVNAARQHDNIASLEVNTGHFELNTVDSSLNTANVKSASTLVDFEKPLVKDRDANDVDVHLYRSMIGSLKYLIASKPDIMFACKKQIMVATSTTEAEYVAAASCCGQKCLSDKSLVISLDELRIDDKLHFIEEPMEIMDHEIKQLERSHIPIIKVRWNSKRGREFT